MVENTTETESRNAMAGNTIDVCYRMADCLSLSYQATLPVGDTMAGIATVSNNGRVGMIGVGIFKTDSGMTGTAFCIGNGMAFVFTDSDRAVVATGA